MAADLATAATAGGVRRSARAVRLSTSDRIAIAVMVWEMLSSRLAQILSRTVVLPNVPEQSYREHLKIYRAIKEGNPRKARRAMREHLENADRIWRLALGSAGQREQDQGDGSDGNAEIAGSAYPLAKEADAHGHHK